jgi:hypothetical protein
LYSISDGAGGITNSGVSIGSSTPPYAKLSVYGAGTGTSKTFEVVNNASTTNFVILDNGSVGVGTTSPFATFAVNPVAGVASNQFVVGSSTATSFLINNSGYVGIGTTAPTKLFQVGTIGTGQPGVYVDNAGNFGVGSNNLIFDTNGTPLIYNNSGGASASLMMIGGGSASSFLIFKSTTGSGTSDYIKFLVGSNGATEALRINTSGFLGVGTSTPYSKLSVWGSGTGSARLFELTNSASTTLASVLENGTAYFLGNVGIGTTSPYAARSSVGARGRRRSGP